MKKDLQTKFSTRQYMLEKDFEIYYYKDKNISKVESHTHNYYEFYFFIEGQISMHAGNQTYTLKAGDMMMIPPKTKHYVQIHDQSVPYRRFVLWVSQDYCRGLIKSQSDYGYIFNKAQNQGCFLMNNTTMDFNSITAKIFHLIEERHSHRYGKDIQMALDLQSLLFQLNRLAYDADHPVKNTEGQPIYTMIIDYIENHISDDLSLDTISNYFHLNKYHISHLFKDETGMSLHQYIIKKRLYLCKEALRNHSDITKIYQLYGFKDYSVFYRAFKKEYGLSPKEVSTQGTYHERQQNQMTT